MRLRGHGDRWAWNGRLGCGHNDGGSVITYKNLKGHTARKTPRLGTSARSARERTLWLCLAATSDGQTRVCRVVTTVWCVGGQARENCW
jgi:hypothetical protein